MLSSFAAGPPCDIIIHANTMRSSPARRMFQNVAAGVRTQHKHVRQQFPSAVEGGRGKQGWIYFLQ